MRSLAVFAVALVAFHQCLAGPITLKHCGSSNAVSLNSLTLSPLPITFPGDLTVSMDLDIKQNISHLFMDVALKKNGAFGKINIPCIGSTNIGTCSNIDVCQILPDILSGTSSISADLGRQIDKILLSALGHKAQCPITAEHVSLVNQVIHLQDIPSTLAQIADGDYTIQITIKDDPTSATNLGCITFDAGIKRTHKTGFLFG